MFRDALLAQTISAELIRRGKASDTPLALVESSTLSARRMLRGTLAELPDLARRASPGPSALLLGEVPRAARAKASDEAVEEIETLLRQA